MTRIKVEDFPVITDKSYENLFNYTRFKPLTRVLNALSLTFKPGERSFCTAVRLHNTQVSHQLQEEIKQFISQEAMHSKHHSMLNSLIGEYGLDVKLCEKEAQGRLNSLGLTPKKQLQTTKALETLTALGGWLFLLAKPLFKKNQSSTLWELHAKDEREHFWLCDEIYYQVYGSFSVEYALHFCKTVVQLFLQTKANYKRLVQLEKEVK